MSIDDQYQLDATDWGDAPDWLTDGPFDQEAEPEPETGDEDGEQLSLFDGEDFAVASPARRDVHDLSSADWAARIVARHLRIAVEAHTTYLAERDRLERWWAAEQHRTASATAHLTAELTAWHAGQIQTQLDEGVKPARLLRRSIPLPCGVTLVSRATGERLEIDDKPRFTEWAHEHRPELVAERTVVVTDGAAVTAAIHAGDLLPGARLIPAGRSFKIEPAKGEAA